MSAPVLVLVHGYPFDHTLWEHVTPLLHQRAQVFTPDLRGFGGQPVGADEPALERMADDLMILLQQNRCERAVLGGMSMGGYVALAFAERYRAQLAGLALVSSQAAADTEQARANRRATIEKVRAEGSGAAARATIPKLFASNNSCRPELARYAEQGAERAGVPGITWALEAMARRPDRTWVFQALPMPALVIHGAEDQFIAADRARGLAQLPARCGYVEIPQAGHATPLEAPAVVAEALNDLVRRSFDLA